MRFEITADDHIRMVGEDGPAADNAGSVFASEQELHEVASGWPMKRLYAEPVRKPGPEGTLPEKYAAQL